MEKSKVHCLLDKLRDDGDLKLLLDLGFVSWKTFMYLDICQHYDTRIKLGDSKMDAVHTTAIAFNVDITTVYRSLKKLGYDYISLDTNDQRKREFRKSSKKLDIRTDY